MIVDFSDAASGLGVANRLLAQLLEERLGQRVLVDNKTGGGGVEALSYVQGRPADGYTISSWSASYSGIVAQDVTAFRETDFVYICQFGSNAMALQVATDSRFKTLAEFIDEAKKAPGRLRIAGSPIGSIPHVSTLRLEGAAGIRVTYVPFAGGGEIRKALLGKEVDAVFLSAALTPGLRNLAVTGSQRFPFDSRTPTFGEAGYPQMSDITQWRGLLAKSGWPESRLEKFRQAVTASVRDARFAELSKKTQWVDEIVCDDSFGTQVKKDVAQLREIYKNKP